MVYASLSHLTVEGLFHLFFVAAFLTLFAKLWLHAKKSGSPIAKHLSLSFLFGGLQYILLAVTILFFADNPTVAHWLPGPISLVLFFISMAYAVPVVYYTIPRVPVRLVLAVVAVLGVIAIIDAVGDYTSTGVNAIGILAVASPKIALFIVTALLMTTFVPIGVGFIYQTIKRKLVTNGIVLGVGLLMAVTFLPMTYQAKTYGAYLFFSVLASTGFLLLVTGVVLHPFLQSRK